MAVAFDEYAPFDGGAGSGAREYLWRRTMRHNRMSGVISTARHPEEPREMLVVADGTDMTVDVYAGQVWIEGHWGELTGTHSLAISGSDATLDRIDVVVARADFGNDRVQLDVSTGVPAINPVAPSVAQTSAKHEIPLAEVLVPAGSTAVAYGNITDTRVRVGSGRFSHWTPQLFSEGSPFGNLSETPVNMGSGSRRYCRFAQRNKVLHIRYFFQWGPEDSEDEWDGGTGRVFTKLPPGYVAAPTGDHRISTHLWTHNRDPKGSGEFEDRDWFGTALVSPLDDHVWPFFPTSPGTTLMQWWRIDHELSGSAAIPDVGGLDAFPEGGHLVIQGLLEVQ